MHHTPLFAKRAEKQGSLNWLTAPGLPELLFAKGPNLVQKEPNSKTWGQKRGQTFFQIYQQLQSHMNP